jgi:ABC-type sugar transport system ATPase subunit
VKIFSDRVAIFSQGSLMQEGSLRECMNSPASRLVADFVSFPGMNYRIMKIQRDGPYVMLRSGRYGFTVSEYIKRHLTIREGEDVIVGINPEDVRIRAYETGNPAVMNLARVTSLDHVPGGLLVHVDADGMEWIAMTETGRLLYTGQLVELRPDPDKIHLFHPVNGLSILD